mgnify:CR=1 FL=1
MTKREAKKWVPTVVWTDAQKILAFDDLHALALKHLENIQVEGCYDDADEQHYIYEEVVGLLGDDAWDVINKLSG